MNNVISLKHAKKSMHRVINLEDIYVDVHRVGLESLFKKEKINAKTGDLILMDNHMADKFVGKIFGVVSYEDNGRIYFHHGSAVPNNYFVLIPISFENTLVKYNSELYTVEKLSYDSTRILDKGQYYIHTWGTVVIVPYKK
jgi:hypothetical protein